MSFTDSLMANPSAGVYGQPGQQQGQDVLGIVNNLKDREMRDFQNKANFMSDLSLKQDRLKALFNPEDPNNISGARSASGVEPRMKQNVVMGHDPNEITGAQKAELGIRQQQANTQKGELGVRQQQVNQQGKMGEERLGIQNAQEKLNQQKSDQIHEQKTKELEEKINEGNRKFSTAQAKLDAAQGNAEASLAAHKEIAAAIEERHKLEMEMKDHQFNKLQEEHDKVIKNQEKATEQRGREHKVQKDAQGNEIVTDTSRGSAAENENDPLGIR